MTIPLTHLLTLSTDPQPWFTTVNMWTCINPPYGKLYDLVADPGEYTHLWDDPASQDLNRDGLLPFITAAVFTEPLPMPRIAGA